VQSSCSLALHLIELFASLDDVRVLAVASVSPEPPQLVPMVELHP
jgi:hypothetical protein